MAKLYTPGTWEDEILAGDERYNILDNGGSPIETNVQIALATGVVQAGTPVDAGRMNNIENGIDQLDTLLAGLLTDIGDDPKGEYSSLVARLVAIEAQRTNLAINGGFDVWQRQDPNTPTSRSDDQYGPDRWYVLTQTGAINVHRVNGDTSSQYAARLTQAQATAQRFGIAQIVEAANSIPLRGRTVRFQARVKSSVSQTVRCAILAWTGGADNVISDVVNVWSSASYMPGGFFAAANLTVIGTAAVTASPDQYSDLAVTGVVPANCSNLIVVVWTESAAAQNVTIDLTQAGLYDGAAPRAWLPRPIQQEIALCQRYYEKSKDIDLAPDASSFNNGGDLAVCVSAVRLLCLNGFRQYEVQKRTVPTIVLYAYNGTPNAVSIENGTNTLGTGTLAIQRSSTSGFEAISTSDNAIFTVGSYYYFGWTADAEL